jgi:hypothetical protein
MPISLLAQSKTQMSGRARHDGAYDNSKSFIGGAPPRDVATICVPRHRIAEEGQSPISDPT